jgi:hypothetical protein
MTWGRRAIIEARARTEAEPDSWVSHQTRVNWTSLLPKRENACPAKTTQNLAMDWGFPAKVAGSVMMYMVRSRLHFNVPSMPSKEKTQFHPSLPGPQRSVELITRGCWDRMPVN